MPNGGGGIGTVVPAGALAISVLARDQASATFAQVGLAATMMANSVGGAMQRVNMLYAALGGAMVLTSVIAIKAAMDFEHETTKALMMFGKVADETRGAMEQMALTASREFGIGATDAAKAFYYLGSAGLSTEQAMGAFNDVLKFSKVGLIDTSEAAEMAMTSMKVFGYRAEEVGHVTDMLMEAVRGAQMTTTQLGDAFSYVAPVAKSAGITLAETSAIIGVLANAGIKGSMAGTSLRRSIINLIAPTGRVIKGLNMLGVEVYDAAGKQRDMVEVLGDIFTAMQGATEEVKAMAAQYIFGTRAVAGMLATAEVGVDAIREFSETIEVSNATQEMWNAMQGDLAVSFSRLIAEIKAMALALGKVMLPAIKVIIGALKGFFEIFSKLPPVLQEGIALFIALEGPILLLMGLMPLLVSGLTSVAIQLIVTGTAGTFAADALLTVSAAIATMLPYLFVLIPMGIALFMAYRSLSGGAKEASDETKRFGEIAQDIEPSLLGMFMNLGEVIKREKDFIVKTKEGTIEAKKMSDTFSEQKMHLHDVETCFLDLDETLGSFIETSKGVWVTVEGGAKFFEDWSWAIKESTENIEFSIDRAEAFRKSFEVLSKLTEENRRGIHSLAVVTTQYADFLGVATDKNIEDIETMIERGEIFQFVGQIERASLNETSEAYKAATEAFVAYVEKFETARLREEYSAHASSFKRVADSLGVLGDVETDEILKMMTLGQAGGLVNEMVEEALELNEKNIETIAMLVSSLVDEKDKMDVRKDVYEAAIEYEKAHMEEMANANITAEEYKDRLEEIGFVIIDVTDLTEAYTEVLKRVGTTTMDLSMLNEDLFKSYRELSLVEADWGEEKIKLFGKVTDRYYDIEDALISLQKPTWEQVEAALELNVALWQEQERLEALYQSYEAQQTAIEDWQEEIEKTSDSLWNLQDQMRSFGIADMSTRLEMARIRFKAAKEGRALTYEEEQQIEALQLGTEALKIEEMERQIQMSYLRDEQEEYRHDTELAKREIDDLTETLEAEKWMTQAVEYVTRELSNAILDLNAYSLNAILSTLGLKDALDLEHKNLDLVYQDLLNVNEQLRVQIQLQNQLSGTQEDSFSTLRDLRDIVALMTSEQENYYRQIWSMFMAAKQQGGDTSELIQDMIVLMRRVVSVEFPYVPIEDIQRLIKRLIGAHPVLGGSFQRGGIVPETGLYGLHKGETVAPTGATSTISIHIENVSSKDDIDYLIDEISRKLYYERQFSGVR